MVDCALVIVSYRSAHDIAALLDTVPAAMAELSWQAVVVNNDPADDLAPVVSAHPETVLVQAEANLGYAGGINLGLTAARPSTWTIFLNPDLRLAPGAIAAMAKHAGHDHAVVPKIVDDDGVVQHSLRREPTILGSLGDALFGDRWDKRPSRLAEMVRTASAYDYARRVDWATGAALLVPTTAVEEVGCWDSARFFLYSEETDYCRRLREAGTSVRFLPDAVVSHRGGGSGTSDQLHALLEVNRLRYFQKWHRTLATGAFGAVVMLNNLLRIHRARNRAALRALLLPSARSALPGGQR